jgi:hypothetical protein
MLAGYYVVYVTTPHPQSWHVETSFARLLAQLWPTAVLAAAGSCAWTDRSRLAVIQQNSRTTIPAA